MILDVVIPFTNLPLSMKRPQVRNSNSGVITSPSAPTSDFSAEIKDAWDAANKDLPKTTATEKFLNNAGEVPYILNMYRITYCHVEDLLDSTQGGHPVLNIVLPPVKALIDTTGIANAIENGVNGFLDGMPVFMNALDDVAKIHSFIAGAFLISCTPGMARLTAKRVVSRCPSVQGCVHARENTT
jgi:hypothetical protein